MAQGTALITGASTGIGRELAKVFAEGGFDLVVVARGADRLEELAAECRARHGAAVEVLPADLLAAGAPARLYEEVQKRDVRPDVLVNNAGVLDLGAFHEIPLDAHERVIGLNVAALTSLTHRFLHDMVRRGRGRILNVASVASFQPVPSLAVYAATKAFVLSLTESLSEELKGTGVTVTALCPGFTRTDMVTRAQESSSGAGWIPEFAVSDAAAVAREGFEGCMAGRVIVVPDLPNKLGVMGSRLYPRWVVRAVGGLLGRRMID